MRRAVWIAVVVAACSSDADRTRATPPAPVPSPSSPADTQPAEAQLAPHLAAIGDTSHLSAELRRAFDPAGHFTPMGKPRPGEWLAEHPEAPQTYADYVASGPNLPDQKRSVIYLLPIGDFARGTPSMVSLAEIVRAFFTLEVRLLPAVRVAGVVASARRDAAEARHRRRGRVVRAPRAVDPRRPLSREERAAIPSV